MNKNTTFRIVENPPRPDTRGTGFTCYGHVHLGMAVWGEELARRFRDWLRRWTSKSERLAKQAGMPLDVWVCWETYDQKNHALDFALPASSPAVAFQAFQGLLKAVEAESAREAAWLAEESRLEIEIERRHNS